MKYGGKEWTYAEPIARGLLDSKSFRVWLLKKTRFASNADGAQLLHEEMKDKRSRNAQNWWVSHWQGKCKCAGCSGQQTDVLAIFKSDSKIFALHFEIKNPDDDFKNKYQARNYTIRAQCWARKSPDSVISHSDADTVLVFDESKREEFQPYIEEFGIALTFDEIHNALPSDWNYPNQV